MTEEELNARLDAIHARLQWISDAEARAAWVNGLAARGILDTERERLIQETERVLDDLQAMGGSPRFKPS